MPKYSILFGEFPGGVSTMPWATDWVRQSMKAAENDGRFDRVMHTRLMGTPITALRNRFCRTAVEQGFDYAVMIDSDMWPDKNHPDVPSTEKFFPSSVDFLLSKCLHAPAIIAAPYCGPPPHENCYVFRWRSKQSSHPNPDWCLEGYTREEAAIMGGISRVAAIPTGVCIFDVRGLAVIQKPWFYYGYKDSYECSVVMTEDVAWSRNWGMSPAPQYGCPHGLPIFCNWDAWAIHTKLKHVHKPQEVYIDQISSKYVELVRKGGRSHGETVQFLGETPFDPPVVFKGDAVEHVCSNHLNDPRRLSSIVPPCTRGELDPADMVVKDAVMRANPYRTRMIEVIQPLASFGVQPFASTFDQNVTSAPGQPEPPGYARAPVYENERDLVSDVPIDYSTVTSACRFKPTTFPHPDPLSAPTKSHPGLRDNVQATPAERPVFDSAGRLGPARDWPAGFGVCAEGVRQQEAGACEGRDSADEPGACNSISRK